MTANGERRDWRIRRAGGSIDPASRWWRGSAGCWGCSAGRMPSPSTTASWRNKSGHRGTRLSARPGSLFRRPATIPRRPGGRGWSRTRSPGPALRQSKNVALMRNPFSALPAAREPATSQNVARPNIPKAGQLAIQCQPSESWSVPARTAIPITSIGTKTRNPQDAASPTPIMQYMIACHRDRSADGVVAVSMAWPRNCQTGAQRHIRFRISAFFVSNSAAVIIPTSNEMLLPSHSPLSKRNYSVPTPITVAATSRRNTNSFSFGNELN